MFSKIVFGLQIHSFGYRSCFGFIDSSKLQALMQNKWNQCFLHTPRDSDQTKGIFGLSASLREKERLYCCKDGLWVNHIDIMKTEHKQLKADDTFIFEIVFGNGKEKNYCNVYINDFNENCKLLTDRTSQYTFEDIPDAIIPIYSHEDHGESKVTVKMYRSELVHK